MLPHKNLALTFIKRPKAQPANPHERVAFRFQSLRDELNWWALISTVIFATTSLHSIVIRFHEEVGKKIKFAGRQGCGQNHGRNQRRIFLFRYQYNSSSLGLHHQKTYYISWLRKHSFRDPYRMNRKCWVRVVRRRRRVSVLMGSLPRTSYGQNLAFMSSKDLPRRALRPGWKLTMSLRKHQKTNSSTRTRENCQNASPTSTASTHTEQHGSPKHWWEPSCRRPPNQD